MSAPSREIILGVGGGIAAYKACDLLRRLQDRGYGVTVVPTPSSLNFVGRATWEALSGRLVTTQVFEAVDQVRHVSLARDAEAVIIAPATADLIARIASGRADDLLTNTVLASSAPILLVPAMHPNMWSNSATQENVARLRARGMTVMDPDTGALTSGDTGKGRFPSTQAIIEIFEASVLRAPDMKGIRVLVTAGGTREAIDPVRFIGNRSSGRQGIAIAEQAALRGASVTLIVANSDIPSHPSIERIDVETVEQLQSALQNHISKSTFLFMAAAVSDVRVKNKSASKVKKEDLFNLELERNPDIIRELATKKREDQVFVAFAAESDADIDTARKKMLLKGADIIYLNDVVGNEIFGSHLTTGWIIDTSETVHHFQQGKKEDLSDALIDLALGKVRK